MSYFEQLQKAMSLFAEYPNSKIIGQTAVAAGTAMHNTIKHIPKEKRFEFPVIEATQLNFSIGLSLNGFKVLSIFPRWNFLLVASSQVVNTLDKISLFSEGEYDPKILIRVGVGSEKPLWPNYQHVGNFSKAFRTMLVNTNVVELNCSKDIVPAYTTAIESDKSTILVEFMDKYNEE